MKVLVISESTNRDQGMTNSVSEPGIRKETFPPEDKWKRMSPKFPPANVCETETNYILELLVPGIDQKQLEVEVDDNRTLSIVADGDEEGETEPGVYRRREFANPGFTRFFELPKDAIEDRISIDYTNGILTLLIPKDHHE